MSLLAAAAAAARTAARSVLDAAPSSSSIKNRVALSRGARFASSSSPPTATASPSSEPLHEHLQGLEHIDVDVDRAAAVATLRLNRPRALNALSTAVCDEVVDVALRLDADAGVRALVVTGQPPPPSSTSGGGAAPPRGGSAVGGGNATPTNTSRPRRPVFAAGADIREMAAIADAREAREGRLYQGWRRLAAVRMPLIGAVNGVALGGGCELALMCDVVVASEDAEFGLVSRREVGRVCVRARVCFFIAGRRRRRPSLRADDSSLPPDPPKKPTNKKKLTPPQKQPEVSLGVIPLMGGTQRLARLCGRAVAMDVALTGRRLTSREALAWGLVSRVVGAGAGAGGARGGGADAAVAAAEDAVVSEAQAIAKRIASLPARAVEAAKHAVAFAADAGEPLEHGLDLEERLFHQCFASRDRTEGMAAFLERRPARWER
jgi:enoyl-CoA hydratase/carnithine racemase